MNFIQRGRDSQQAGLFATADVSPRMRHQIGQAEGLPTLDLKGHGVDRPVPERILGARHVDEVRVVPDRLAHAGFGQGVAEGDHVGVREGFRLPLVVTLRKNLDCREADAVSSPHRKVVAPGHRHVRSDFRHACLSGSRSSFSKADDYSHLADRAGVGLESSIAGEACEGEGSDHVSIPLGGSGSSRPICWLARGAPASARRG